MNVNTIYFSITLVLFMTVNTFAQQTDSKEHIAQATPKTLKKKELTLADRKHWRNLLQWPEDCEAHFSDYGDEFAGLTFHNLDENQYIIEVTCIVGAYQGSHLFYWVEEQDNQIDQTQLLEFEQFTEIESLEPRPKVHFEKFTDALVWGTTLFNAKNNELTNLNRYRGAGGCGTRSVYKLERPKPKVVEFRARVNCTPHYVPPERWKRYPLEQIAHWPIGHNPLREQ